MALTHTPGYTNNKNEDLLFNIEEKIKSEKNRLVALKTKSLALTAEIQADGGATTELKALATQVTTFFNHAKFTDFIDFISTQIG